MPVYNPNEAWLKEAVDSILNQTFKDFEIIIADDGSEKSFGYPWISNKKIRVLHHNKNYNQATAMNTGLKHASGEYICFLDCDDKWAPDKLNKQVEYLDKHKEIDMVYADGWYINEKGEVTKNFLLIDDPSNILKFNHISVLSTMVRKSVFDKVGYFDEKLFRSQDWEMWVRIYKARFSIKKMNDQLVYYRQHANQKNVNIPVEEAHAYIRRKHNLT